NWFHRALYSNDSGATWTPAASGLTRVDDFGSRIELAYAPSQPTIVYGSCAANGGKIWLSVDGGVNYVQQTATDSSGVSWYANPLWVDPTNPSTLVTGAGSFFRSTDSGVTLQQTSSGYIMTRQPHPDEHFVVSDPGFNGSTNRRVYVCTDGSIWRADDI